MFDVFKVSRFKIKRLRNNHVKLVMPIRQLNAYFMGHDPCFGNGPILGKYRLDAAFVDARISEFLDDNDPEDVA